MTTPHIGDLILVFDAGTQSIRAALIDQRGIIRHMVKTPIEPYFSKQPGWAEQEPAYFWDQLAATSRQLLGADDVETYMAFSHLEKGEEWYWLRRMIDDQRGDNPVPNALSEYARGRGWSLPDREPIYDHTAQDALNIRQELIQKQEIHSVHNRSVRQIEQELYGSGARIDQEITMQGDFPSALQRSGF